MRTRTTGRESRAAIDVAKIVDCELMITDHNKKTADCGARADGYEVLIAGRGSRIASRELSTVN